MKNILFICKFNRFRSRVAESYFNKINKNKSVKAKSAGLIKGSPLSKYQVEAAKSFGINISGNPQGISTELLKWQDCIVNVADDVPSILFKDNKKYGKKLILWNISDVKDDSKTEVDRIIKSIMIKVDKLVRDLK